MAFLHPFAMSRAHSSTISIKKDHIWTALKSTNAMTQRSGWTNVSNNLEIGHQRLDGRQGISTKAKVKAVNDWQAADDPEQFALVLHHDDVNNPNCPNLCRRRWSYTRPGRRRLHSGPGLLAAERVGLDASPGNVGQARQTRCQLAARRGEATPSIIKRELLGASQMLTSSGWTGAPLEG